MKDSAQYKWEIKRHTEVKHTLLEKYLSAWFTILGKTNRTICYFDSFAGRGQYEDGTLGSPVIALKKADLRSAHFAKLKIICIEKDQDNFSNLKEVLERESKKLQNRKKIDLYLENSDFDTVVTKILDNLEQTKRNIAPSFFFIDPFGYKAVPFNTIKRILAYPKTEIFFTFMISFIHRFLEYERISPSLTRLFGTDEWHQIIDLPDRETALIELYREQLHRAGVKFTWQFKVYDSGKLSTKYYLIHATNNFRGHEIMKEIMHKESAHGSFAFLGPKDISERSQTRLFDPNDPEGLPQLLFRRFEGRTISFINLQKEICAPWYLEPPYVEKHYRAALKKLVKQGKVEVRNISTTRGLSNKDKLVFRSNQILT